MKVQVPIIHLVRIFMISRTSTYHNTDYVEFVQVIFLNINKTHILETRLFIRIL